MQWAGERSVVIPEVEASAWPSRNATDERKRRVGTRHEQRGGRDHQALRRAAVEVDGECRQQAKGAERAHDRADVVATSHCESVPELIRRACRSFLPA